MVSKFAFTFNYLYRSAEATRLLKDAVDAAAKSWGERSVGMYTLSPVDP